MLSKLSTVPVVVPMKTPLSRVIVGMSFGMSLTSTVWDTVQNKRRRKIGNCMKPSGQLDWVERGTLTSS